MRGIFQECLPIGDKTEDMDGYFNRLKEVISTNDFRTNTNPIRREEFDYDDPDIQYTYISDAIFKERSGKHQLRAIRQDMGDQPDVYEGQVPQLGSTISADPPSISECETDRDFEYGEQDCDNSSW